MIQRIQTVYLAIVGVLLLLFIIVGVNLATLAAEDGVYQLTAVTASFLTESGSETVFSSFPVAATVAVCLLLTAYAITQYKNRKLQIRLIQIAMTLQPIIGIVVFFYANKMAALSESASLSYSPFLGVLILNLVLYFLALRGVKKDEALVRSADRLR